MYMGRMVEKASRDGLYTNPLHPYTRALIASAPSLDPGQGLSAGLIKGEVWDLAPPENGCVFFHRCSQAVPDCEHLAQELVEKEQGHFVACWRV
jgi:oligopeptide/dipeptide ABC transporter ATP-binding protein